MKTKKFIREVEKLDFSIENYDAEIEILDRDDDTVASVAINQPYSFDTYFFYFDKLDEYKRKDLFNLCYQYAATPIADREEEKKYYVKTPRNWIGIASGYFIKSPDSDNVSIRRVLVGEYSLFTESEIEKYHLENFEKVEVEDE